MMETFVFFNKILIMERYEAHKKIECDSDTVEIRTCPCI